MDITDKWLKENRACAEAKEWIAEQSTRDEIELIKICPYFSWVYWYTLRRLTPELNVAYDVAIDNARAHVTQQLKNKAIELIQQMED